MEFNPRKLSMSVIERYQLALKRHDEKKEALASRTALGLRRAVKDDLAKIKINNPDALKNRHNGVQIGGGLFAYTFYPKGVEADDLDKQTFALYHTIKKIEKRQRIYENLITGEITYSGGDFYRKWARVALPPEGNNPAVYIPDVAIFTIESAFSSRKGRKATADESAKYVKLIYMQHLSAPLKDQPEQNPDELFNLFMG